MDSITNQTIAGLTQELLALGEPRFRAAQVLKWIYQKRIDSFDEMNNLPKTLLQKLKQRFCVDKLAINYLLESKQGDAVKFGFDPGGGDIIESVILYDGKRRSLCVSSQLGCALGCRFCATGGMGFIRNLDLREITGQIIAANDYLQAHADKPVTNIIFMGMGEALANFDTFRQALEIIMHEECFGIRPRRITVSTAGVIPHIERLLSENIKIGLAISLNSYSDETRSRIMPINRKYPIRTLIEAARAHYAKFRDPVTFEYVLVHGENDTPEAATALIRLLKNTPCKINLIPLNPGAGNDQSPPPDTDLNTFGKTLAQAGLYVTVRKSRGRDICGACGQLAGKRGGMAANV